MAHNPNPKFTVDGISPDGTGNWDGGEGANPPFIVFDTEHQEYLPTLYAHRADAETVADGLNKRNY